MDIVNEVAIAGHDARLRCYGAEENATIYWWRSLKDELLYQILGTWRPGRGGETHGERYFFADNWSDTLHIKGAVATDAGIYTCKAEEDPESYGHLTILSMHAM